MSAFPPISEYLADGTDIWAYCAADIPCGHHAKLDLVGILHAYDDMPLDEIKRRLRCSGCRHRPAEIRLVRNGRPNGP
jgi:hypothetical protein